jgi:predicted nucleic-acid-binding protein
LSPEDPGFLGREVMLELVWVLERGYRLSRAEIVATLEALLAVREMEVETGADLIAALIRYGATGPDFADLMIAAAAHRAGARKLVTFDRAAARLEGVELVPPAV